MTAAPCRAETMCPAEKCVPGGGAHGPRPTGRYVGPRVGDGVLQWSAAEQMPLGYDVPPARQRRADGTACRVASLLAMTRCAGADDSVLPVSPPQKTHLPLVPAAQKSDRQAPVTWLYRWNRCLYSSKYWAKEWDFMARTLDRYSWVSKESDSSSMMATATLEQWSATRS